MSETTLHGKALAVVPLTRETMEDIYTRMPEPNVRLIKSLCESHERLRLELEGATKLNDELEMTADKLSTVWLLLDDIARSQRDSDQTRMAAAKLLRDQQCPGWKEGTNG